MINLFIVPSRMLGLPENFCRRTADMPCRFLSSEALLRSRIVYCAHQVIKAAVDRRSVRRRGQLSPFVIGLTSRNVVLPAAFIARLPSSSSFGRPTFLKPPELYRQILALLKYLACVLHGHIVMCQHYYDLRFHFFSSSPYKILI